VATNYIMNQPLQHVKYYFKIWELISDKYRWGIILEDQKNEYKTFIALRDSFCIESNKVYGGDVGDVFTYLM
jgi:hypothetical protein